MILCRSWGITDAVIAMTGMVRVPGSARSRPRASTPLIPGVHQDEGGVLLARQAHAVPAGLGLDGLVTLELERVAHQLWVLVVVLDDEDQLIGHGAPEA